MQVVEMTMVVRMTTTFDYGEDDHHRNIMFIIIDIVNLRHSRTRHNRTSSSCQCHRHDNDEMMHDDDDDDDENDMGMMIMTVCNRQQR